MPEIIWELVTSWQFLLVLGVLIAITLIIFRLDTKSKSTSRKKKPRSDKKVASNSQEKPKETKKEASGKLYVPNSNYEILKKECIIHPPKEDE